MNFAFQTRVLGQLQRLFRRAPETVLSAEVPAGTAVYSVGDIHGRIDLLDDLLTRIGEDAAHHPQDVERRLIFLGDYIDRGLTSRDVVDRLLQDPLPGFMTVRRMGNHEEAILDSVAGRCYSRGWVSFGGLET